MSNLTLQSVIYYLQSAKEMFFALTSFFSEYEDNMSLVFAPFYEIKNSNKMITILCYV